MPKEKALKNKVQQLNFPYKLWAILESCNDGALRWSSTGVYIIVDVPKFEKSDFIKEHFHNVKWSSFVRQLNLYGFKKAKLSHCDPSTVESCGCKCGILRGISWYSHEFFRRDSFHLLSRVIRNKKGKVSIFLNGPSSSGEVHDQQKEEMEPIRGQETFRNLIEKIDVQKLGIANSLKYSEFLPEFTGCEHANLTVENPSGNNLHQPAYLTNKTPAALANRDTNYFIRDRTLVEPDQLSLDEPAETSANTTTDSETWTIELDYSYESEISYVYNSSLDIECAIDEECQMFSMYILPDSF